MQPMPPEEQMSRRMLPLLTIAELRKRREGVSAALEKTFEVISRYAEMAAHIEPQFQQVLQLENRFQKLWDELEAIVDTICSYAALSQYSEQAVGKLGSTVREYVKLVQAISSPEDITSEWLARRDAFVAQAKRLLDDEPPLADTREERKTPP